MKQHTNFAGIGGIRFCYAIATILLLIVEVFIALYVHDDFIRPYIGDVLVVIVIYTFIRIWFPKGIRLLPLYVFLFATGVEVLQYFKLVERLGLENNTFMRIVLGSVFDVKDIICYGVGCILLGIWEVVCYRLILRRDR